MPRKRTWTDKQLTEAVKISEAFLDVLKILGLKNAGGNYVTIKRHIKRLQLDIDHFLSGDELVERKMVGISAQRKISDNNIFLSPRKVSTQTVRRAFKRLNKEIVCSICGISNVWKGKPLVHQIDHIDGDNKNCLLKNLRWLCPNCHSQTPTFGRRNKK